MAKTDQTPKDMTDTAERYLDLWEENAVRIATYGPPAVVPTPRSDD